MHRPFDHIAAPTVIWPADHDGEGDALLIDYRWMAAKEKTQVAKAWLRALPGLTHNRKLFVYAPSTPALLDAISDMAQLDTLMVHGNSLQDLSPLARLRGLQHLKIGPATKVQSIAPLTALHQLNYLDLCLRELQDFSPLQAMDSLRHLLITRHFPNGGPGLRDVTPFASMAWLESLSLDIEQVVDLRPLAQLKTLKALNCLGAGLQHTEDLAWLSLHMPGTACVNFHPTVAAPEPCPRCGGQTRVYLTLEENHGFCTLCDAAKLAARTQRFDLALQAARDELAQRGAGAL